MIFIAFAALALSVILAKYPSTPFITVKLNKMPKKNFIPNKLQPWIAARKKYRLSHAQIQMARELGLNPKKFGNLIPTKQQQWKLPLAEFIEEIYFKHFKKRVPDNVRSIEQMVKDKAEKKATRKEISRQNEDSLAQKVEETPP